MDLIFSGSDFTASSVLHPDSKLSQYYTHSSYFFATELTMTSSAANSDPSKMALLGLCRVKLEKLSISIRKPSKLQTGQISSWNRTVSRDKSNGAIHFNKFSKLQNGHFRCTTAEQDSGQLLRGTSPMISTSSNPWLILLISGSNYPIIFRPLHPYFPN